MKITIREGEYLSHEFTDFKFVHGKDCHVVQKRKENGEWETIATMTNSRFQIIKHREGAEEKGGCPV